ncbi:hypothetical protein D1114_07020 [Cereibacter sphaeroides]|uniref:Tip attachment protein J domain-containing protein n=1 Tax=Cereibacter sphaeroides TaxID=1063 RepID=A0AAX1UN73_CERSP|nr:phage tail protein [Cereibacter sphaeroides]RHZ96455.1 hypothetical protein D1114_07020 [Cereibacter sphaeroides]
MKRFWRAALLLSASWIATPAAADPISTMVALVSNGVAFGTALTATFGAVGAFLIKMTAALAFTALTRAKVDKPKPAGIATEFTKTGGTNGQTLILGTYATAGTHVCPPMWHDRPRHQADNPYLTYVIDVADLPGHDLSRVAINGEWVEFGPNTFEFTELYGDRALGKYADDDRYGSHAWLRWHDGTQVAADEMLLDYYSDFPRRPWSTDHIGTGVAYAIMTFQHKPRLFSGLPQVRFEVLGIPLYDPRKDSTVGGSGAQRWNNRATWQRTQNPAVMIYNILRGISLPDGSIWGGECEAEDLPLGNWITAMNVCDEPVTLAAGGTEPRYRAGIEIDVAEDQPADIIEMLLDACSGAISESGGTYRMRAGGPGLPVYVFSDDDLLVTSPQDYVPFPGLDESHNGCHATYPDPRSVWEQRDAKPYYRADYQAQDQGRQIVASVQLPACPYPRQVQRLMRAWIEDDRRWRRHNLALGPYACMLEALDIVAWSSARNGYSNKSFEIDQSGVALMTCHTALAVREVDPTDYGWVPGFELPDDPAEPGYDIPPPLAVPGFDVLGVSIEDATSAARRPALRLVWDGTQVADDAALSWEVRLSGGADVLFRGTVADANSGRVQIAGGILPATTYQARARLETPRRQLQWTAWEAALTPNTRLTGDDLAPGAIEDAIADRLAELDAAAEAAAQEAQAAAVAAAGVREDHDALVAGFVGKLTDAFAEVEDIATKAVARGWVKDPTIAQWDGGLPVATNWSHRSGLTGYATQFSGRWGGGLSFVAPASGGAAHLIATSGAGLNGAQIAQHVVATIAVQYESGASADPLFRAEWSADGSAWISGTRPGGLSTTFADLGIAPAPGIVQLREFLFIRPAGSYSQIRLRLTLRNTATAQSMKVHLLDLREATEAEIAAAQVPGVQATVTQQATTLAGLGTSIAQVQIDLSARINANGLPSDFAEDGAKWSQAISGAAAGKTDLGAPATFVTDGPMGRVARVPGSITANCHIAPKAYLPNVAGKTYRATIKARHNSAFVGDSANALVYLVRKYDKDFSYVGDIKTSALTFPAPNTIRTFQVEWTSDGASGAPYILPFAYVSGTRTSASMSIDIQSIEVVDISGSAEVAANLSTNYLTKTDTNSAIAASETRMSASIADVSASVQGYQVVLDQTADVTAGATAGVGLGGSALGQADTLVITENSTARVTGPTPNGANIAIPPARAILFGGQKIKIGILARTAPSNSATRFGIAYSVGTEGNSGYMQAAENLTASWKWFTFYYAPPASGSGADILSIFGDNTKSGKGVRVARVYIEVAAVAGDLPEINSLSGEITDIKGLDLSKLDGTAMGALLTQLDVQANGTSAAITAQGSAIADLEGNASAGYLIRAQAGGSVSLLDLVAADGSAGSVSVAKLAADTILLDGTVSLPQLVVTDFSGNLVVNGAMPYGDTRGWIGMPTSFLVIPKSSSPPVLSSSPTPFVLRTRPDAAVQFVRVGRFDCRAGDRFVATFDRAAANQGSGINGVAGIRYVWYDASGAPLTPTARGVTITTAPWTTEKTAVAVAPAGASSCILQAYRGAGDVGEIYITNMEVLRQRSGSLLIAPQSITGAELIATEAVITQQAQIGALTVGSAAIRKLAVDTIHVAGDAITTMDVAAFGDVTQTATNTWQDLAGITKTVSIGDKLAIVANCIIPFSSTSLDYARVRLVVNGVVIPGSVVNGFGRADFPDSNFSPTTPYGRAIMLIADAASLSIKLQGRQAVAIGSTFVGVGLGLLRAKK